MKRLRKQINESFFNPVLHFLPLITFMVVEDFMGLFNAWFIAIPVNILLFVYVFFTYRKIFEWFLFSTAIFLSIATIASILPLDNFPQEVKHVAVDYVLLTIFAISLALRKKIESFVNVRNSKMLSMVNNLNELFRMMWIVGILIFVYVHLHTILIILKISNLTNALNFINGVYLLAFFVVICYEMVRVTLIRIRLLREEWWPIVNEQGKMIGSIHHTTSIQDDKKYIHPIIRVMLIDGNRIFLQKRSKNDLLFPGMWDTAVSNHIRMSEKIDQCVQRTANERYGLKDLKPIFLSNYILESAYEFHYAFLFVACKLPDLECNPQYIDHAKWWTLSQIEANIESGIFTDNFLTEIELVKRSGLLESGICECDCRLKQTLAENALYFKQIRM